MEAGVRVPIAILLEEQGDISGAIREYEAAMEADPLNCSIPFNMGVCLEETDNEGAIVAYRKALALDASFSPANVAVAKGYRSRIVAGAQDNSFQAGLKRAEDVQHWLGALLRAKKDNMLSPEDAEYCDEEIQTINSHFPKVWAVYQATGERAMMAKI